MDWTNILSISPDELDTDTLKQVALNLDAVNIDEFTGDELRQLFELSRFIIKSNLENDQSSVDKETTIERRKQDDKHGKESVADSKQDIKGDATDESHYIQTIHELNREIAQSVYNKSSADAADSDSTQPLRIDTKKDLLYKIHIKNKYIKRLLCEYGALKDENERLKEQVLMLNVNLKQAAHKLTEAIIESMEQKRQHHLSTDDIVSLHTKIIDVRQEMARIETDKQQFKRDILNLGDEIQRKIDQWNEKLKKKYSNMRKTSSLSSVSDDVDGMANSSNDVNKQKVTDAANDERLEVNLLSQAVHKRNVIISEMEMLLTELTMEISNSAIVINRVIKNLSNRENNVATNLEKLQHHLSKFLSRPVVHIETQTPSRMTGKHCV